MWNQLGTLISIAYWKEMIGGLGDMFTAGQMLKSEEGKSYTRERNKFLILLLASAFLITLICL